MHKILLKRAYEPPSEGDGARLLVDRIWPRGKTRESLRLHSWQKAIAPSNALRNSFAHHAEHFEQFTAAYIEELEANPEAEDFVEKVRDLLQEGPVTLVYGAKDQEHNQAVVLKSWLEQKN